MNVFKQYLVGLALKSFQFTSFAVSMALLLSASLVFGVWATIQTLSLIV